MGEKSADLAQNLLTGTNPKTIAEGVVGAEQIVDAAVSLKNEATKVEGQSSESPAQTANKPSNPITPFSDVTVKKIGTGLLHTTRHFEKLIHIHLW